MVEKYRQELDAEIEGDHDAHLPLPPDILILRDGAVVAVLQATKDGVEVQLFIP